MFEVKLGELPLHLDELLPVNVQIIRRFYFSKREKENNTKAEESESSM